MATHKIHVNTPTSSMVRRVPTPDPRQAPKAKTGASGRANLAAKSGLPSNPSLGGKTGREDIKSGYVGLKTGE